MTLDELKKVEEDILLNVTNYCTKEGLTYVLAYGTLLGAVRHKGFIPWDDDVDVYMPRNDYERFIKCFSHPYLHVSSCELDSEYCYPFAKVSNTKTILHENGRIKSSSFSLGINIDIFPMDYIPCCGLHRLIRFQISRVLRYVFISKEFKISASRGLIKYFFSIIVSKITKGISTNSLLCWWNRYLSKPVPQKRYIGCLVWGYGRKEIMSTSKIFPPSMVVFNNHKYFAPKDCDYYLTKIYGNYLALPPEKERITHHCFDACFLGDER